VGGPRPPGARRPAGPPPADATNALLLGTIIDDIHGAPVPGVELTARVEVTRPPARGRPGRKEAITVGSARTGPDGTFAIGQAPGLPDWVVTLADCRPDQLPLTLDWRFGGKSGSFGVVQRRPTGEPQAPQLELRLHLDISKARPDWKTLATNARATGAVRLNELVIAIRQQTPVVGAGIAMRAVTDLETAFLDPTGTLSSLGPLPAWADLAQDGAVAYEHSLGRAAQGAQVQAAVGELHSRLASFDSLTQVDWPLDLQKIGRGAIAAGVNASADLFKKGGRDLGAILNQLCKDPLIGYRDYLVGVWGKMAKQDWYWAYQGTLTFNQALDQLTNRFHQDFTTIDTTRTDAGELAIITVTRLLTEPAPTGLGVAAGTLPARGADTSTTYLQKLVAVSGVSARELGLRYRINLNRVNGELSSPVDENIATLLSFFRDSFQSEADPFHTAPDIRNDTMIAGWQLGKAPFFLEYEEWLAATAPFYGQNVFSMTRSLRVSELSSRAKAIDPSDPRYTFTQKAFPVFDQIEKGLRYISQNEYRLGLGELEAARNAALTLIADQKKAGYNPDPPMQARRGRRVTNKTELLLFERYLGLASLDGNPTPYQPAADYLTDALTEALVLYAAYFYWVMRSDASLAVGEFTEAAKCLEGLVGVAIGAAEQDSAPGYFDYWNDGAAYLYTAGPLPYTTDRSNKVQDVIPWWHDIQYEGTGGISDDQFPTYRFRPLLHKVDRRFIELRLGNVLLEWADALFRADDPSSISRARELYKAVLWLHGEDPGISPAWPGSRFGLPGYYACQNNPAVVSQVLRARLGFTKIEAGLNYFGSSDVMVPVQRYRTLKDTADRFAALAKAAERDFLTAIANLEGLSVEQLRTSNLLVKARAQRDIAGEQEKIAEYNVKVAKQQVADVNAQIAAKQKEIADHDSFFGQLGDFGSGIVKTFTGLPSGVTSGIASGFEAELVGGDATSAGLLGLGAGASIMAGFGLFWYAGYTSMSGMEAASNGRATQLHRLQDVTLALAEGGVVSRQHEVTIANLQASIASADISLAQDLLAFHTARLLNSEFWATIALVLKRVLRRYLDIGAWAAWLAERALAFEQDGHIRLVRMDYLAPQLQGVTGGDLLQSDLAELEAARVAGERVLVPFRMVISLTEDQPLAFGALKTGGTCSFTTSESSAREFFPGTYGHRIRVVDVEVRVLPTGRRARGILVNHGVSLTSTDESLVGRPLLRFPDALPISETAPSAREDPRLIEVLGPFEGTGLDTTWTLEFDREASPGWWDAITDVIIRIEGRARFSEAVRSAVVPPMPRQRFVLVSGAKFGGSALKTLRSAGSGTMLFDLKTFPFSAGEKNRKVSNVMVLMPGAKGSAVKAHLHLVSPVVDVDFSVVNGVALSNGQPLRLPGSLTPDEPLNKAIGVTPEQTWTLDFKPSPGADLSQLVDVILGIEYMADPV
jgi:hypothetical protein